MKTLFICRASIQEGMGHLLRTSHVAAVAAQYVPIKVAMLGMESLGAKLRRRLVDSFFVPDEENLITLAEDWGAECIFFDLLSMGESTFFALRRNRFVVSLSPVFNLLNKVDLIFHRSSVFPEGWNEFPDCVMRLCGLRYAVIDRRVSRVSERHYGQTLRTQMLPVAVSMGGTDAANKTSLLLRRLKDIPVPMLFWVLLGEGYAHSYQE